MDININFKKRNIVLIGLYRVFSRMYFYLPIMFPLFYFAGESVLNVELLLAAYGLSTVIFLPLARISIKNIGHKYIIEFGELFKILGLIILIFHPNTLSISFVAQALMGLGYAFIVGNDTMILQQMFEYDNSEEYQSVQSKTNSYMFLALLFSGLVGTIIFKYNIEMVLVLSIFSAILSIICIACINYKKAELRKKEVTSLNPVNKNAANYYFLTRGVILSMFVGIFPYFFLIKLHISIILFGAIISIFTLSGFYSSRYLAKYLRRYGFNFLIASSLFLALIGVSFLLSNSVYLGFSTAFIFGVLSGCVRPITVSKIDNKKHSVEKTLQNAELNYAIFSAALLTAAGIFIEYMSFFAYIVSIITILLCIVLFKVFYQLKERTHEN